LPDTIAYLKVAKQSYDFIDLEQLMSVNYHNKIFLTPFWDEIYVNDNERKETKAHAMRIENAIIETYTELGFEIVILPKDTVDNRLNKILTSLSLCAVS